MNRWHNYYLDRHAHFCTASVSRWRPLLDGEAAGVVLHEWELARRALGVRILAYCIMPDHFHLIVWGATGERVRRFLHRTLAQTSRRPQPGGGFWKERPRVLPVYSRAVLRTKVDYIHANPVRRGLVSDPADWEWSGFREWRRATAAAGSRVMTGG